VFILIIFSGKHIRVLLADNASFQFSTGNKSVEAPLNVWQNQFSCGLISGGTLGSARLIIRHNGVLIPKDVKRGGHRMSLQVFPIQVLRIPGWRDFRYPVTSLLNTWGRSGYPLISIWPHSPSLHRSHSDLLHGVSAIGIFKLRISFFSVHQYVSMISCFWYIL